MTPTDPLYAQQWHFDLIGDIEAIWDDYSGAGVTVSVYDEGVEYTHPDLAANFDTTFFSYNGNVHDPVPVDGDSAHGTAAAGLIGAVAGNGLGGVGVAWGSTLLAVNYLDVTQSFPNAAYEAAMLWAGNFDIMSNSWGVSSVFVGSSNLNNPFSLASQDVALFEEIAATGRQGLGTIIVKAAGNETHNVNGDGWNVSRYTITVSATDQWGRATYYTNYGSAVLVAAPAAEVTTDQTGNDGYNTASDGDPVPVDYTSTFGGTSAATPVVSGVVALMLEANPDLGWRDVQNILALSASHTGSELGASAALQFEADTWITVGGTHWNGGGTAYNPSYGYGMVDAFAAVRFAEAWAVIYPGQALTSANEQSASFDYAGAPVAIPDSDGVEGTGTASLSVVSTSDITVEAITITLDMTHAYGSDMDLWLMAPDGTMIQIYDNDGRANTWDNGMVWTFEVDSLRGYSAQGTWTVVAEDTATGDVGTLNDVEITFYGSGATVDDVYNFTQDFQMFVAYETERSVLGDANGGTDWLNFGSIQADMAVHMQAGGAVVIGGEQVATIAAGLDVFENFYAGDGADQIWGNSLQNTVYGVRGDDQLHGKAGTDSLNGGVGDDKLLGEKGADTLCGAGGADTLTGGGGADLLIGQDGADVFVFKTGAGKDSIEGWQDDSDVLKLDDALWGGGMTVDEMLAAHATVVGGDTVLAFGTVKVTLLGVTDVASLSNDIVVI